MRPRSPFVLSTMSFTPSRRVDGVLKADTYSPSSSINTVCVSGRVPMAFSMSKYCVISSKSTIIFSCGSRDAAAARSRLRCGARFLFLRAWSRGLQRRLAEAAVSARRRASQLKSLVRKSLRLASEAAFPWARRPRRLRTVKSRVTLGRYYAPEIKQARR